MKPFCDNPMCEYHRVADSSFIDHHTIKTKRRGKVQLKKRLRYRLISDEGATIFEENLCDSCGNVIDMIEPAGGHDSQHYPIVL